MASQLTIRVNTVGTQLEPAEARVLVDGEDLIQAWFPEGEGVDPDVLLGQLAAGDEPRQVMIGQPECDPGCCGSLEVRIRRAGDEVIWDHWSAPGVRVAPTWEIRFDTDAYAAELDRADRDRGWEWTGRTVVRLARRLFAGDPALLARFGNRRPEHVLLWPLKDADSISIPVPAPPHWQFDPPRPHTVTFRFEDRDPSVQAADLIAALTEAAASYR
jgi:hypothetical protein